MRFTDLFPLVSAVFVFFLGLTVLIKNKHSRVNFTFFLHSIAITIWLFGTFMMFVSRENRGLTIFWDRFVYLGVVLIPVFMYHFGLAYTNKKRDFLLYLAYALSGFFLVMVNTRYFVDGVFEYQWGVHTRAQLFHHLFLAYFIIYVVIWFVKTYAYYKSLRSESAKQQAKYIFIGFLFLFSIGPLAYLPAYGISIYPFSYVSGLIFTIIIAYAIIVHRLMDIKLVMRRYLVLSISAISILLLALGARALANRYFSNYVAFIDFGILALAVLLYPILRHKYYRIANRYFFSSLYDSREVIVEITDKLRATLDITEICDNIHSVLNEAFHMRSFGMLDFNEQDGNYRVKYNRGFEIGKRKKIIGNGYLREVFVKNNEIIITEEVKNAHYNPKTKKIIDELEKYKIDLISPLNTNDKTVGLLVFGPKESGDMYNEEDLAVLKNVSAQAAIAMENALLYEEVKEFNAKLKEEVEKATRELRVVNEELKKLDEAKSEFLNIASHQLRTPVSVIKSVASMLLAGDLEKATFQERQKFYQSVMFKSKKLETIIHDILNATSLTANKYNVMDQKAEAVDLKVLIAEILQDFALEIKARELSVELLPEKAVIPEIRGQKEYLKEVFINLITNAIKYTPSSGLTPDVRDKREEGGIIKIKLGKDPKNKGNVLVTVEDNGIGVAQKEIPKLFQKFSRAENAKNMYTDGTGIGLFVVKEIVSGHGGKVWLESEVGKGSTFFVSLPVYAKKEINIKKYILTNPQD